MSEDRVTPKGFEPVEPARLAPDAMQQNTEKKDKPIVALALVFGLSLAALALLFLPGRSTVDSDASVENTSAAGLEQPSPTQQGPEQLERPEERQEAGQESAQGPGQDTNIAATPNHAETPWADSQQQKARRQSQEVLSQLIDIQQQLQELRIEEWAPEAVAEIQTEADQGDRIYQERNYEEAIGLYQSALDHAQSVLASAPVKAEEFFTLGSTSLENNQTAAALRELELATLLDPTLQPAKDMYERAKVRDAVLALEITAERQLRDNDLEQARESYRQIQTLDSSYSGIQENIASVDSLILERDFRQAMSEGYTNLSLSSLSAAQQAFEKADKIKPNNPTVSEALQQVEAARINNQRQTKLDNAIALEAAEQWADALGLYQELIAEDATLSSAQLGKIRSEARSNLDAQIQSVLDEPLKLQAESTWLSANKVLTDAKNVIDRGPVLDAQIEQLDFVIKRARTKVTVALYSDSQTSIEIYRMGELGQFKEHAVALYPGKYVVLGKRPGYRDVREELVLDGNQPRVDLNIQCVETI